MTVRSIIDIVVNDGSFKAFAKLYQQYSSSLPRTTAAWQAANVQIRQSQTFAQKFDASLAGAVTSVNKMTKVLSQDQVIWRTLVKHSDTFKTNIASATTSMLRLAGFAGITGGLLGIGSLFGLEHLAAGVGAGRREAAGVGTTYGQQRAFELTYSRFLGPGGGGVLNRISEALSDPAKGFVFQGVNTAGGNSVDVARQLIPIVKRFVDATPDKLLGRLAEARGYLNVFTLEQLKALRGAQPGELAGLGGDYARRFTEFGRNPKTERSFQDFDNMLDEAGEKIRTAFVEGIAPLIPALTDLSKAMSELVRDLLKDVRPADVKAFGEGIKSFAATIGSPEFRAKVEAFVTGVGRMADTIAKLFGGGPGVEIGAFPGQHRMTFKESLGVLGGGGAEAYYRGDLVYDKPIGPEMPVQLLNNTPRSHTDGARREKSVPMIGGTMGSNFNEYWSGSVPQIKNQSSTEVHMTLTTPAGASMPRAATQIGSTP